MQPARTKYRKFRKVIPSNIATSGHSVSFGEYAIKAVTSGRVTGKQIETVRRILAKKIKKTGRIIIRIFPHLPVTQKPIGVRMGGGKGGVEFYVASVAAGTVMFEMDGITIEDAKELFTQVKHKMPVECSLVKRRFSAISEE
jgi:large subunit ribosomal protein L16